jgi:DNA (cytosine-5)-methyltransferase 1
MSQPVALDLFCGAGGVSKGLHDAGFDVVGVDIEPQPEYPFTFVQADALTFPLDGFDFIWASPKCQRWSPATRQSGTPEDHPDQIVPIRERLRASGVPYVIENVPGAPLIDPIMLCGAMFGLGVVRHRLFECSFPVLAPPHGKHKGSLVTGEYVTVAGDSGAKGWTRSERAKRGLPKDMPGDRCVNRWREAMGIDWMSKKALAQAIPPAYAEWIGKRAITLKA